MLGNGRRRPGRRGRGDAGMRAASAERRGRRGWERGGTRSRWTGAGQEAGEGPTDRQPGSPGGLAPVLRSPRPDPLRCRPSRTDALLSSGADGLPGLPARSADPLQGECRRPGSSCRRRHTRTMCTHANKHTCMHHTRTCTHHTCTIHGMVQPTPTYTCAHIHTCTTHMLVLPTRGSRAEGPITFLGGRRGQIKGPDSILLSAGG